MGLPYTIDQVVFNAAVLTETKALETSFSRCLTKVIQIVTTGFTGTIDIQGRANAKGTYANVPYQLMGQAAFQAPSVSQLSYSTTTATAIYLVTEYYPDIQIVMTRSAGSVTVIAAGFEHGMPLRIVNT